ncbi:MAG: tRNA (adenosine(37)-N6)-dimethylallyltransferase MiaA [Castellaniella sp.]
MTAGVRIDPPVLCLTGPTAAGKSAAVRAVAERWPVEIINVDSATIYRGMDIGTAKPGADERARIHHHLLDIRDPAESYSAAAFRTDATRLVAEIRARGRIPVLCGGTMLYLKALEEGLAELPEARPEIRAAIDAQAAREGWPAMHRRLAGLDPETAARLAPNDRQRIQRALEVVQSSGRSLSDWLARAADRPPAGMAMQVISLEPSVRAALHERIALRFHEMMEQGFLQEVQALHARDDLNPDLPSMRCVGYRQLYAHLAGEYSLETAVMRAIAATRQLAKRQLTWLRARPERTRIDCLANDVTANATAQVIDAFAAFRPA